MQYGALLAGICWLILWFELLSGEITLTPREDEIREETIGIQCSAVNLCVTPNCSTGDDRPIHEPAVRADCAISHSGADGNDWLACQGPFAPFHLRVGSWWDGGGVRRSQKVEERGIRGCQS